MKNLFMFFISFCFLIVSYAQIDSIDTNSSSLLFDLLNSSTKTYVVYMQDSMGGKKYNFEVWDRTITKDKNSKTNTLHWARHKNSKGEHFVYEIKFDDQLKPLSEKVIYQRIKNQEITSEKKHFIYENDGLYSSADTTLHNTKAFKLDSLNNSFNWELDLELLSLLPINKSTHFAINFYHPGSKMLPKYYVYNLEREEEIYFQNVKLKTWVLKVDYNENHSCEFWIDQNKRTVMLVVEHFYGKHRIKRLVI